MAHAFPMKKGTLLPTFAFRIEDSDGNPADLSTASQLNFRMAASGVATAMVSGVATIMESASGMGCGDYWWQSGDTDAADYYQAEVEIVWNVASKTTVAPAEGFYPVRVYDRLT